MSNGRRKETERRRDTAIVELDVASLAPGGPAIAFANLAGERRAVFIAGAAPGDRVRVAVDASRSPARGTLLEVLAPSRMRVEPPCVHAERCGGCDWMHLSPTAQLEAHTANVRAVLPASWQTLPIARIEARERVGYRTRARVHVRAQRRNVVVGLHQARTHAPVRVDRCAVLHPVLDAARARLAALFAGADGSGEISLSLGFPGPERRSVLDITFDGELPASFFAALERACAERSLQGARVLLRGAARAAVVGDATPWLLGADGEPLELAPGGFAQASEEGNRELVEHVAVIARAAIGDDGGDVHELFAGAGNLTVLLARFARVVAVERSKECCDAAQRNLSRRSLSATVVCGDAEQSAPSPKARLLVLDPPRTGARAVAERLAQRPLRHVIYVSCDAPTLGRDLGILAASGYEPDSLALVELFPQTSHVETVVHLVRSRGPRR